MKKPHKFQCKKHPEFSTNSKKQFIQHAKDNGEWGL